MDIEILCEWLRENSSGTYRKSADAAYLIEQLTAENARLQSVIDEANAQEPVCKIIRNEAGQVSIKNGEGDYFDMSKYVGFSLYARPIPAQKSPWLQAIDEALVLHHVGVVDPADTYDQAKQKLNLLLCAAESIGALQSPAVGISKMESATTLPAVAVPELNGWYCAQCQCGVDPSEVTYHETHTVCGRYITDDVPPTSPRITEQDAREIIIAYISSGGLFNLTDGQCHAIESWIAKSGRALLNKLNGGKNGQ